jgi:hypothetical protein
VPLVLTASQIAAIKDGARIRQVWSVLVPQSAGSATAEEKIFHDDDSRTLRCVTRAGTRTYVATNFSPIARRQLQAVRHSFEVSNVDSAWYPRSSLGGAWLTHSSTSYEAVPQECQIRHRIYIGEIADGVLSWTEVTALAFHGRIVGAHFVDGRTSAGARVGSSLVLEMESVGAWDVLRREWTIDDSFDTDSGSTAPDSVDWIMSDPSALWGG